MYPELKFFYGPMSSMKTATVLIENHTLRNKSKCVWLLKSAIDNRSGIKTIASRAGNLSAEADAIVSANDSIIQMLEEKKYDYGKYPDIILIDECQFLSTAQIEELREIVSFKKIPVYCYGLKTDANSVLFEGSKRLFEIADSFFEFTTYCECGEKAIINARIDNFGHVIRLNDQIDIGGDDKYQPMCYSCWIKYGGKNGR